ncbi:LpqB family beta-propeller domain-containing protein [Homoserinibacter gongjuensis]|uniref:LpqB family beta-propeller domain-containing protein n=1 Tax=Homoserinibacter gongjuensis TaxID=1162968 RepID=UPI003D66D430
MAHAAAVAGESAGARRGEGRADDGGRVPDRGIERQDRRVVVPGQVRPAGARRGRLRVSDGLDDRSGAGHQRVGAAARAARGDARARCRGRSGAQRAGVWRVAVDEAPVLVDGRAGLIDPSIDARGFVWTAVGDHADSIRAIDPAGACMRCPRRTSTARSSPRRSRAMVPVC